MGEKGAPMANANNSSVTGSGTTRRRFLAAAGSASLVAGAGCLGGDGGGSSDAVKVGLALPTSGAYAGLGEQVDRGIRLRLEEELDGEIDGREIEITTSDTASDVGTGTSAARSLVEQEGVNFLLGPISSGVAGGIMSVVKNAEGEALWLNCHSGNSALVSEECYRYHVRTSFNTWQISAPMADYMYNEVGENIVLTYPDYAAGQQFDKFFSRAFEDVGGSIVDTVTPPLGNNDYSQYISQIESADPDAVWAFYAGADAVGFMNAYSDFGLKDEIPLAGVGASIANPETFPALGEKAVGVPTIYYYTQSRENDANEEFQSQFQDAYDEGLPNWTHVEGYDTALLLEQAVRDSGSAGTDDVLNEIVGKTISDTPRGEFTISEQTHDIIQDVDIRISRPDGPQGHQYNEIVETIPQVEGPQEYENCNLAE
jgi:branched-chain amino acid transport system substrate-binding protein